MSPQVRQDIENVQSMKAELSKVQKFRTLSRYDCPLCPSILLMTSDLCLRNQ